MPIVSDHRPYPDDPSRRRDRPRPGPWWTHLGLLLGVILAVSGLLVLGFLVVAVIAMNGFGSNK